MKTIKENTVLKKIAFSILAFAVLTVISNNLALASGERLSQKQTVDKIAQTVKPNVFQTKVVTVQGFVENLDMKSMQIRIDGHTYQLHRDVEVISRDNTVNINEISIGDFVISTIEGDSVVKVTLVPQETVD